MKPVSTYAIGDIHGCYDQLQRLLELIRYDPQVDRLWLTGDLVNRGPQSTEVLRWAVNQGDRVTAVLGNHDLHVLALERGVLEPNGKRTVEKVFQASDRDTLIDWICNRPLLHRQGDWVLVHAGLMPCWTIEQAQSLAQEVEGALRGPKGDKLLAAYYKRRQARWRNDLTELKRHRVGLAAFTLLRTCAPDGTLFTEFSGAMWEAPKGAKAWFSYPKRESIDAKVVFGHWAALGFHTEPGIVALDSGCVWHGRLTAMRLEDERVFDVAGLPSVDGTTFPPD